MPDAINDFSHLKISGGAIHYKLYRQDGTMQAMCCLDTLDNRRTVSWMQIHDGYTGSGLAN